MGPNAGGYGGGDQATSTLFVTGFSQNSNDRELENFCRFLPGFVFGKASMKGYPRVWVRFENPESARAALPAIDGQPFDMQDPMSMLKASVAKTDTNPPSHIVPRKGGASCVAGHLDELLGLDSTPAGNGDPGLMPPPLALPGGGGGGSSQPKESAKVPWRGRDGSRQWDSNPPWSGSDNQEPARKRPRTDESFRDEMDTLCVMALAEQGLTEQSLHDFFTQMDGFVALSVSRDLGKGGANGFVKFEHGALAREAMIVAQSAGVDVQMARTSLKIESLTPERPSLKAAVVPSSRPPIISARGGRESYEDDDHRDRSRESGRGSSTRESSRDGRESNRGWSEGPPANEEKDTLCLIGVTEKGLSENSLADFFLAVEGFQALRYTPGGKGAGMCFVKFAGANYAKMAMEAARANNIDCQTARTSLNISQATFIVD